jgi:hypothetical protein
MDMNSRLRRILFDIEKRNWMTDEYFSWSEDRKEKLTHDIMFLFYPFVRASNTHRQYLMADLLRAIEDAEKIEDYEQAEILSRCRKVIEKIVFHNIY